MLNGHLDTVSLASYDGDGLTAEERDGNLYGRGAYDMKSGVGAIMMAAATAAAHPHAGDIVVALVADEEWGSAGTEEILRHVVTDTARRGRTQRTRRRRGAPRVRVGGGHHPRHGHPRIQTRSRCRRDRQSRTIPHRHRRPRPTVGRIAPHPTVAVGSVHASTISGGEEASSYPDRCTIVVERRTIPGETAQTIEEELRQILDATAATDPEFRYSLLITASRSPFAAQLPSRIQEVVTTSYSKATGAAPVVRGEPFWTDCALLAEAGVDTVLFGVDGGGAHAATESVTLVSLHTVTEVLAATIRSMAD